MLFEGRVSIGAFALGIAQGYYNKFARAVKDNPSGADVHRVAKMATALNSARSFVYNIAKDIESMAYQEQANYSAQAKIAATEAGLFVCNADLPLDMEEKDRLSCERHYRDIRLSSIGEGTTEILEFVAGKLCLKK